MVELLILKDNIDAAVKNRDVLVLPALEPLPMQTTTQTVNTTHTTDDNLTRSQQADQMSQAVDATVASGTTNTELLAMLTSYEELGRKLRHSIMVPAKQSPQYSPRLPTQTSRSHSDSSYNSPSDPSGAQSVREGMISLRDLTYLQRREFKVQEGQVGDHSSDISNNNVCKQIEEAIKEGFQDTEIVCGVLRIIKPGTFKDMLINKDDLTVMELKGFLQAHLREKNSTELSQELMCTRKDENETPQQFLYRVIGVIDVSYSHPNCQTQA